MLVCPLVSGQTPLTLFPVRPLWTLSLNSTLSAPPGFDDTRGYFPIDGNRLVAYDLSRGEQLWLVEAPTAWQPVSGDGLVFTVQPEALVARRERDGSEAWRIALTQALASRPAWSEGWLVVTTAAGAVLAYSARDGREVWRHAAGAAASAAPAFAAGRVYVALVDRRVLALQITDGTVVWERRLGGPATDTLALHDRIYAGATDNFLYCIDADSGLIDWRVRTGADVIGVPAADEDRVYFVSLDNVLRGLTRKGGTQEWKRALPMRPRSGPLLAAGTIIVGGIAPTLRAFSTKDGTPAGEISLAGGTELSAPPHLVRSAEIPLLIAVTSDIVNGATVTAISRVFEPTVSPLAPLPNPLGPPAPPAIP